MHRGQMPDSDPAFIDEPLSKAKRLIGGVTQDWLHGAPSHASVDES